MAILTGILNSLLILTSLFLICLVLIQRGKGGGLAGAFGGVGGSSAFGTKAGDVFTRVTIIVAGAWFALTLMLVVLSNRRADSAWKDDTSRTVTKQLAPSTTGTTPGSSAGKTAAPTSAPTPSSSSGTPTKIPMHDSPAAPVSVPAIPDSPAPSKAPAGKTP